MTSLSRSCATSRLEPWTTHTHTNRTTTVTLAAHARRGFNKGLHTPSLYLCPMPHCFVTVLQRYKDGVCSLLFCFFFIMCHPLIFTLFSPVFWLYRCYNQGGKPPKTCFRRSGVRRMREYYLTYCACAKWVEENIKKAR